MVKKYEPDLLIDYFDELQRRKKEKIKGQLSFQDYKYQLKKKKKRKPKLSDPSTK